MTLRTVCLTLVSSVLLLLVSACTSPISSRPQSKSRDASNHSNYHSGPFISPINFFTTTEKSIYSGEEAVKFHVYFKNVSSGDLHFGDAPVLRVGELDKTNNRGIVTFPLSWIAQRTLSRGEQLSHVEILKQNLKPGWYQAEIDDITVGSGQLSGGGTRFFVEFPKAQVLSKTIYPNVTLRVPNRNSITVQRVTFTPTETKVYFHVHTTEKVPIGFQLALDRSNGQSDPGPVLGATQKDAPSGGIDCTATFQPTTVQNSSITLVVREWDTIEAGKGVIMHKGQWTANIPIR